MSNIVIPDGGNIGSASDTDAISISSSGAVTLSSDFVPATPLSHRNMIINGEMQVAQRGASHTSVSATAYQLDRFETTLQGLGTYTITRDTTDAPKSEGFGNSYKIDCTSADASPGSSDFFFISHKMEGQNLQHLQKGTSSAKSLTLSFWCRCTKTGNIQVNIYDWDNARIIAQTVTINSADTWEKKTLTFPGDTTGALTNHVSTSLVVEWWLDKGSNFSGGSVPTSWATFNNTNRAVGTTLALGDNTANNFYITGVQLELGSVATPFEHKSYSEELARCQRYFEICLEGSDSGLGIAVEYNNNQQLFCPYYFRVSKRTDQYAIVGTGTGNYLRSRRNNNVGATASGYQNRGKGMIIFTVDTAADAVVDGGASWVESATSDAFVAINDEL
ncbi:putative carbohydrate binding domain containing protein [uncultured Mediterranean phage uvMED]|nr:putative carbohydrate binding domain containing protein [uncultured Mediterranean phage uvMED]